MSTFESPAKPARDAAAQRRISPVETPQVPVFDTATIMQLQGRIGNRAVQRILHQQQVAMTHTIQRVPNEIRSDGIPAPSLKEEIVKQYTEAPSEAFHKLWASKDLKIIDKYQSGHEMPHHSEAKISDMDDSKRPANPDSVKAQGYLGNEEAKLRGDVEGEPYDGGHLVAYNFLGKDANTFLNAAPQGKKLDNGPFSLWEDKILGGAVRRTAKILKDTGIPRENLPHIFDYNVWVDYASGDYFIGRNYLIKYKMIPPEDSNKVPFIMQFTKRIPVKWTAVGQPLPFPSSDELESLGAKQPVRRPNTPHIGGKTSEYGIQDEGEGIGNFKARGASEDVDKLYSEESARGKLARTIQSLDKNPKFPLMEEFYIATIPVEEIDKFPEEAFSRYEFNKEQWKVLTDYLVSKDCMTNEKIVKQYFNNAPIALIQSPWRGIEVSFLANLLMDLFRAIKAGETVNLQDAKLAGAFMEATVWLAKSLQKLRTGGTEVKWNNAGTIDFTNVEPLVDAFHPDLADFRFEASETQPD